MRFNSTQLLHPDSQAGTTIDSGGATATAGSAATAGTNAGEEDIQARIDRAIQEETSNLRDHVNKTIKEKREMKSRLDSLSATIETLGGEEGISKLVEMRERLAKDELGQLLADGKYDEWYERKTKALRKSYDTRIEEKDSEMQKIVAERDAALGLYKKQVIESSVRASCSQQGVRPEAVDDVLMRATSIFDVDTELGAVIKDSDNGVELGKDGKTPKSIDEWLTEQQETRRHWWPPSKGADAVGGSVRDEGSMDIADIANVDEWRKKRAKLGIGTGFNPDVT